MQADTLDIEKIGELLQKISSAAIRASDVISRLRKMLKPHTKQTEHVNINTLIEESVAMAKSDSQALDFTIDLRLGEKLPKVVGDAIQIQQVILNLIRNAMESAFLEDKDNKRIILCTSELDQENRVKVSVEDLGCGISHQDEDQVFSPFYTTKPTGMGIGLAICQSIIQEHGGKLWFTRNEHKGTTFHFTLTTAVENEYE